ncbi:Ig-like domain (group 3) [Duganella sacchari]|uniref:Ig-like domain (Group 3) n=1 Tax=Duganella sacchari TaxID=551987 RepID=A0A1M7RDE7_9BURK|nr:Ig-like domain-containing protein [Duganella sacchari]SHN44159.1 Ig-like domain (group 3) [Duganella sacchari]
MSNRDLPLFHLTPRTPFLGGSGDGAACVRAAAPAANAGRKEALLIDTALEDRHVLAAGARPGMAIVEFDGQQDGLAQLVRWAAGTQDYDALHLVCHGAPARLQLGARTLDSAALNDVEVQAMLASLGMTLRQGASLMLYACQVAEGAQGVAFVAALSQALGVPVAAASGILGAGAWTLDHAPGVGQGIRAALAWPEYAHTLTVASTETTFNAPEIAGNQNYNYSQVSAGYATPYVLSASNVGSSGWDVVAQSSSNIALFAIRGIGFGTNGYGTAGEGDSSAIRVQADDVDYVTFKANASSYCFDLNEFYLRNNVAPAITVQAVNSSGATVGSAVTFSGLLANSYNRIDLSANTDFRGIYGFKVTFGPEQDAPYFDTIRITNITTAPVTLVSSAALSADTGSSTSDFVTKTAAQTISGSLSANLGATERVEVSFDGGASWQNATTYASGSSSWSTTTTLVGSGTFQARVTNSFGSTSAYSHSYTLDTVAPTTTVSGLSLSADTGTSSSDFITQTAAQNISATLSAGLGAGDVLYASKDNGATWTDISSSVSGTAVSWSTSLSGSSTLKFKVTDLAGNDGAIASQAYQIDTVAPTITVGSLSLSADTGASSSDFITQTAAQTISATLSTSLGAGDILYASKDNGATWTNISSSVSGTAVSWSTSLTGSSTLKFKVTDVAGNDGTVASQTYTIDTTAPAAPSTPDLAAGSDSGSSNTDNLTNNTTPTITGTAESGSTVTLYDSDGSTVLGTATATGGNWSVTASTLTPGTHNLSAKATDAAGNVSSASSTLAVTIDTSAPSALALSSASIVSTSATSGASIGTLSASDSNTITYALATGNGTNDADNGSFTMTGSTLSVGGATLTAGSYHVYLSATDAAGNVSHLAQTVTVLSVPTVSSIVRAGGASTTVAASASSATYTVTFSESVTGVDASDFVLTASGNAAGTIASVTGSGSIYTVTVNSLGGDGSLRLDLKSSGTGIQSGASVAIGSGYTAGQTYTLDHTAPAAPSTPDLAAGSDSGISSTDNITSNTTPTITGTAESGSTVTLYDSDGTTVLGTATATGGNWSITSSALTAGLHNLTTKATDAAGNVSAATSALAVTIDTAAPASVALSSTTAAVISSTSGAALATLSATDSTTVSYALATGNGTNDADNASFAISGTSLNVGGAALSAGTYHIYLSATDAAGNVSYLAQTILVQNAPAVLSIVRAGGASAGVAASATTVSYTVTFSESVTGVDASDFTLTSTGNASGTIASVTGSGATYTVTINTLGGDGNLRLDLNGSGTGIQNGGSVAISGGYISGQTYALDHSAPAAPTALAMTAGTDTGISHSDAITNNTTPTFTGVGEANAVVHLYDTDGTTLLGTATADGAGNWTITSSTLSAGNHTLSVKQTDAAGNVSTAGTGLAVVIDTSAAAPATPALASASDGGIVGDGITNVATPTITGAAEANAAITLYDTDGVTVLGTATADGSGHWSIVSSMLSDGNHTLTVQQTDRAGNVSTASAGLSLLIDTAAPSAPSAPTLAPASDSGTQGDNLTNIATPVLTGTAAANATVKLYDSNGTTVLGTATADGAGNWSITSSALSVGAHNLSAKQFDLAGNASPAGGTLSLTIEAPPTQPATTIDGVPVTQQPVSLPGGGSGMQIVVPIVSTTRSDNTGSANVADIPLVTSGASNLLMAQVAPGLGLTATGGASAPAGSSTEHLIQAILAATPDHPASDQGHLTGNGVTFLNQLASSAPLLVQTIVPSSGAGVTGAMLTLTGASSDQQHTALVIDASHIGAGNTLQLNTVNFAAIIGAANVSGNTNGQILTGDQASQQFTVAASNSSSVFAGGGSDLLRFSTPTAAAAAQSGGALHAGTAATSSILHGGLDTDTAQFSGASTDYVLVQHHAYLTVSSKSQPQQQAVLINVERLQFADTTLTVGHDDALTAVAGLYKDVLGRQADYLGIESWANAMQAGATLGQVALGIMTSQEGQQRNATVFNGDSAHDLELLYQAILGRHSDAAGLAAWQRVWNNGVSLETIADGFMHSQEIVQHQIAVTGWDFLV